MVKKKVGQRKFQSKICCSKKISVQNKFDPRKIWFKKIVVKRIMVKKEFAPKIFQSKNILVKEGICYEKSKNLWLGEGGCLAGWPIKERGQLGCYNT